ncbi:hypothetical protein ACS0TY_028910 [Phlomoides rotata]
MNPRPSTISSPKSMLLLTPLAITPLSSCPIKLIITAGEDCTWRVWDHDGRELYQIKEHM